MVAPMADVTGMLTQSELANAVQAETIDTVITAFPDHYGRLVGKRYDAGFFIEEIVRTGTHACDYLFAVDMEMEPVQGYAFANWELGYGDVHLVPDLATLRHASWLDRTAMVHCDVHDSKTHASVEISPRAILRRQIEAAEEAGFSPMTGSELEYYLYRDGYRAAATMNYADLEPAGHYIEDYHLFQGARTEPFTGAARRHLRMSGVPVENSKGEWGFGQHELNVRFAPTLEMADRHSVYKQCLKEIADQQDLSVTFMAKPETGKAGSSCHVHFSLFRDGGNAFAGSEELGPVKCSPIFRWFLAGLMAHVPDVMVFYAPTVNSYKRYEDGSWAPTRLAWCYDNRTAGFRVVGSGESLRIECRIPGADCNPYLAFAAMLASGMDGVARKLEPPPIFEGDVYAAKQLDHVPRTLREANGFFRKSAFASSAFGDPVIEHYGHFYDVEQTAFDVAVTDWERRRYFERI